MVNILKDWSVSIILILILIIIGLVVVLSSNGVIGFGSGSPKTDSIRMGDVVLIDDKGQVSKNPASSVEYYDLDSTLGLLVTALLGSMDEQADAENRFLLYTLVSGLVCEDGPCEDAPSFLHNIDDSGEITFASVRNIKLDRIFSMGEFKPEDDENDSKGKDSLQKQQQTVKSKPVSKDDNGYVSASTVADMQIVLENDSKSPQLQVNLLESEKIDEIIIKVPTDDESGSFQLVTVSLGDIRDSLNDDTKNEDGVLHSHFHSHELPSFDHTHSMIVKGND